MSSKKRKTPSSNGTTIPPTAHVPPSSQGGEGSAATDNNAEKWRCDVCLIATFDTYDEAWVHEQSCTNNGGGGGSTNNNNGIDVSTLQQELTSFETTLRQTLQYENISYRGSFMQTESTMYQPAHVDYDYSILSKYGSKLFLAFFPLTEEGAYLQLWQDDENVSIDDPREGTVVFIPYGNMLIVPSDTIHGGGFKRGEGGNLRFHLYIEILEDEEVVVEDRGVEEKKEDTNNIALLDHPMNKYTEKYDRRRELCERFVDANGLDKLLGVFFDTDDGGQHQEVQEDIEAINSLAKLVKRKGQNLPSTKSANKLDLHGTEIASATRKSPSSVNLFGLTDEVI